MFCGEKAGRLTWNITTIQRRGYLKQDKRNEEVR